MSSSPRPDASSQLFPILLTSLAFATGLACGSAASGYLAHYFTTYKSKNRELSPHTPSIAPILAIGSANADIFVISDPKLPKVGETVGGSLANIGPGGKCSNQAAAACKAASSPSNVHLITSLGQDEHADMFIKAYADINLFTTALITPDLTGTVHPTGQAYILLEKMSTHNSIIVCPGANTQFPPQYHLFPQMYSKLTQNQISKLISTAAQYLRSEKNIIPLQNQCILDHIGETNRISLLNARIILIQREIPDSVNLLFAFTSQHINQYYHFPTRKCMCHIPTPQEEPTTSPLSDLQRRITVMLDVGGIGEFIDLKILPYIDLLSFNETEMGRVYQQSFNTLPNHIKNHPNHPLLQLNHTLDPESGAIHLPYLLNVSTDHTLDHNSSNNSSIALLQDYSIFSSQYTNNSHISTNVQTITHNYSQITREKKIPFDLSYILHATSAITAMCSTQLNNNSLPQFPSKSPIKLLVTLGTKGSLLLTNQQILHYQSPIKLNPGEAIDSTGCGDSYRGSFATAYWDQLAILDNVNDNNNGTIDYSAIMRFSTASATVCLGQLGTLPAMGTRQQIEALLPRVPL